MTDSTFKPRHFRIYSHQTNKVILHIEDCLSINKIRLDAYSYQRGQGARSHVEHYVDIDTARVIFYDLATGHIPTEHTEMKGSNGLSRILKIAEAEGQDRAPIMIEIKNGPGEATDQGIVKPKKGAPQTRVAIFLDRFTARKIGLAVLAHIRAWEIATLKDRLQAADLWQPDSADQPDDFTGAQATDFYGPEWREPEEDEEAEGAPPRPTAEEAPPTQPARPKPPKKVEPPAFWQLVNTAMKHADLSAIQPIIDQVRNGALSFSQAAPQVEALIPAST